MKSGGETHFVAGVLFTIGVATMAVLPRMASDTRLFHIGGKLSHPFRKALLYLVAIGMVRLGLHIVVLPLTKTTSLSSFWTALDAMLGILHVVGQSFLCLSTAYLLQCQLSRVINLGGGKPGANLVPYLAALAVLSFTGALGANVTITHRHRWWSLINLAESVSCVPVLQTLRLYTSVTVTQEQQPGQQQPLLRGPVLTQVLTVCEIWYLTTSLISFVAEAMGTENQEDEGPLLLLLEAARHNQDNGVDDWTRLLLHSIFLNCIDELNHVQQSSSEQHASGAATSNGGASEGPQPQTTTVVEEFEETDLRQALLVRRRGDTNPAV